MVGTNAVASEVGLGADAGASAAITFWIVDVAINIITKAKKSLILNASIVSLSWLKFSWKDFCKERMCGGKKMLQSKAIKRLGAKVLLGQIKGFIGVGGERESWDYR